MTVDRSRSLTWDRDFKPLFKESAFDDLLEQQGKEAVFRWAVEVGLTAVREVISGRMDEKTLETKPAEVAFLDDVFRPVTRYLDECCGEK